MFQCTSCQRSAPPDRASCLYCGGAIARTAEDELLFCSRSGHPMDKVAVDDIEIDVCPGCGGTWYDRGELEAYLSAHADSVLPTNSAAVSRSQVAASTLRDTRAQYLNCPRCRRLMTRRNYGRVSGVIVDVCGHHGMFIDGDELQRIRDFESSGGSGVSDDRQRADTRASAFRERMSRPTRRSPLAPIEIDTLFGD